jgi:hypothetical protein
VRAPLVLNRSKHVRGVKPEEFEDPPQRSWAEILTSRKPPERHPTNAYDLRDFTEGKAVRDGWQGQRFTDHSKTQLESDAVKSNDYNLAHRNLPCLQRTDYRRANAGVFSSGLQMVAASSGKDDRGGSERKLNSPTSNVDRTQLAFRLRLD